MIANASAPMWSVMIPTYNADDLLEQTLRCVLEQDEGPERMQIVVVDDVSPNGRAEAMARDLGRGRIEFYRNEKNLRLAGNWNRCIARARGEWIHLLHQDDLVRPGFYAALAEGLEHADERIGAGLTHHCFINASGEETGCEEVERATPGVLENWAEKLAVRQRVQCPAIVVRRSVYAMLGGFRADLCFALDWEMWVRIAAAYDFWYEPRTLACYRVHEANETNRLHRSGKVFPDLLKTIEVFTPYLPAAARERCVTEARAGVAKSEMNEALRALHAGDRDLALRLCGEACRIDARQRFTPEWWGIQRWAMKQWVRQRLGGGAAKI